MQQGAVSIHSCLLTFASVSRMPSAHLPCSVTDLSFRGSLPVVSALVAFKNAQRVPTFAARVFKSIRTDNRDWSFNRIKNRLGLTRTYNTHGKQRDILTMWWPLIQSSPLLGNQFNETANCSISLTSRGLAIFSQLCSCMDPKEGSVQLNLAKKAGYTFNVIPPIFKLHFSWKRNKQSYHLSGTPKNPE